MNRATVLILALLVYPVGAQTESLLWPLELKPALSSTFGETRPTAFHAGIDLKTRGKTGYPVRALADGWILRVRTSPWGYGRALYQQLADGRIAVYAHLEGFFEPVQKRVQAQQRSTRQYSVQLRFEEGEIPVRRGQVIARTGQSGAGPPHLHVEIRDFDNVPLNPLQQGLGPVLDTTPPTLRRFLIVPLSAASLIDGSHVPVLIPVQPSAAGFVASRPVRVWGRIGLAIDSHDRADLATNKMAVLRHQLRVDGRTILTSTYERISYADGHLVALDRLRPVPDGGAFSVLFRRPGNRLSFYRMETTDGDGTLQADGQGLKPGSHEVVVWAQDVAGNRTSARLTLEISAPPQINAARLLSGPQGGSFLEADFIDEDDERLSVEIAASAPTQDVVERADVTVGAGPFTWSLPPGDDATAWSVTVRDAAGNARTRTLAVPRPVTDPRTFRLEVEATPRARHVLLRVISPRPLRQAPQAVAEGLDLPLKEESPGVFTGLVLLDGVAADTVVVHVNAVAADGGAGRGRLVLSGRAAMPGEAQVIHLLEGDVSLHVAAGSAFEIIYPQATRLPSDASTSAESPPGLHPVGVACRIGPADAAFDERVRISMRVEGPTERLGIYADDGHGCWVLLGADEGDDGRLSARIRAFGRFALMKDNMPPTISGLHPETGSVVDADITFSAGVTDIGAGIGREEDVVIELDGVRLVSEYDPEAERVTASPDQSLEAGAHHLVLTLRDAAGNETVASTDFISR